MRVSTFTLIWALILSLGTTAWSQQETAPNYPWRISDSKAPTAIAPLPPASQASHSSVRFFGNQEKQDGTGATKGLSNQVPEAPQNPLSNPQDRRPPLNTTSNATDPDYGNQQRPSSWCRIGEIERIFGTTRRGANVGGFVQAGYHDFNLPYMNTRSDRVNVHQVWGFIDRPAERTSAWSFGYRVDAIYGLDGQEIQSIGNPPAGAPSGWDNGWDNGSYGSALPQAYVEMANCDTKIRMGRFLSPFGVEQVPSAENFFYSRTYTRFYTEPFGHTGVIANFDASPNLTMISGLTAGWNTGFDNNLHGFNYIGGFRYQPTCKMSLSVTNSIGDTGYRGSGVLQSAVVRYEISEKLSYVVSGDYLNLQTNDEFGIVQYLFYKVNPCLSFGTRMEWWKSDQLFTSTRSTWDFTSGINYRPHANIVIRPEMRMDYGAAALDSGKLIPAIDAVFLF
jgi:Putative beta-barrel porin-2, OmpL-like. bbp2